MMRDCVFLLADSTMAEVIDGFLSRGHLEGRIGCRTFAYEYQADVVVDVAHGNTDGGVHRRAHQILREHGYVTTHQHAVVVLDQKFGGQRPAAEVREEILRNLRANGWPGDRSEVIVIEPELEVWMWQDSVHVEAAVGYRRPPSLRDFLGRDDLWPRGDAKPPQPKTLLKSVCRHNAVPYSAAVHREIAENIRVKDCRDDAFRRLVDTLRRWFPLEAP